MKKKGQRKNETFYCQVKGLFCTIETCVSKKQGQDCATEKSLLASSQLNELASCT